VANNVLQPTLASLLPASRVPSLHSARLSVGVRRMWINQTSREQFVDFLLEAKRATYAGQGDEATVTPLVLGWPTSWARRSSSIGNRRCGR